MGYPTNGFIEVNGNAAFRGHLLAADGVFSGQFSTNMIDAVDRLAYNGNAIGSLIEFSVLDGDTAWALDTVPAGYTRKSGWVDSNNSQNCYAAIKPGSATNAANSSCHAGYIARLWQVTLPASDLSHVLHLYLNLAVHATHFSGYITDFTWPRHADWFHPYLVVRRNGVVLATATSVCSGNLHGINYAGIVTTGNDKRILNGPASVGWLEPAQASPPVYQIMVRVPCYWWLPPEAAPGGFAYSDVRPFVDVISNKMQIFQVRR